MYRFVDLNDSYWANPDGTEDAQCAILDTVTNRFLDCDGKHVLGDIDEVREAAGERGVDLVPAGFFERKQGGVASIAIADVMEAERALAAGNVSPPYELRATAGALAGLAATLAERCNVEATEPEPMPALQPGETFVGRVSHTLLIAVDDPPAPAFRVKGSTPVGEAIYEPCKGPPRFAR